VALRTAPAVNEPPLTIPILYRRPRGDVNRRKKQRLIEHRIKEGDYLIKKRILEDVKTLKSKKEIKALKQRLEDAALERARREVQQTFPKSAKTAQNGTCGGKNRI
jgi:hypothetical protein